MHTVLRVLSQAIIAATFLLAYVIAAVIAYLALSVLTSIMVLCRIQKLENLHIPIHRLKFSFMCDCYAIQFPQLPTFAYLSTHSS